MQRALTPPPARTLAGAELAAALRDARATTLARTLDVAGRPVPAQAGVNPIGWELGHLAWFAEFWILRGPHRASGDGRFVDAALPPRIAGPDAVFDSARLGHADRWRTPMPPIETIVARLDAQLEACVAAIAVGNDDGNDDAALYFHRLALFHEDMHGEAFAWLRDALGWPAPEGIAVMPLLPARVDALPFDGGAITLGCDPAEPGFAFDNELPATAAAPAPFEIDSRPVTNREFLAFVEATGEAPPERWSRSASGAWHERRFDRVEPLVADAPVVHVDAFQAEAWCRWRGRRLPSAAEWEAAAADSRFLWGGSVWEWTSDAFSPYPGFAAGPYRDYSAPWFGDHRELRGGSFATHARMHDRRYRNFFTPDRRDVFAGFRSAADRRG